MNDIIKHFSEQTGHAGFFCENLITGESFGYHADERFAAASVIKLPVFLCIAKWVSEGKADYSEKIKVKNEDKVPGSGALSLFTDEPTVDIRTLCHLMISVSDNTAANVLIDRFGIPAFAEEFKAIGLKGTVLGGKFYAGTPTEDRQKNSIVLSEIGTLLKKVYKRSFVNARTSEDIENTLLLQNNNHKIPGHIADPMIPIAHKTGESVGVSLDVGIVYAVQPFVLCFAGNETDVPEFDDLIRRTAHEIFCAYNTLLSPPVFTDTRAAKEAEIAQPSEGETPYSPKYIYRQIFGTSMRGHYQAWPNIHPDELRLINPDTVGWIHMEGSPISYPVVKAGKDADYYLTHNFSGERSIHGAVSLRGAPGLGERTTVLGAHHMKDGSMFFALTQLFFPAYYEKHRGLDLLLADGLYRAEFFAVHLIRSADPEPIKLDFSSDEEYAGWIAERKKQSLYDMPLTPTVRDRVLVMTTCIYPDDPEETCDEFAAYAVLHKAEDRSLLPAHHGKRGKPPELLRPVNLWHPLPEDYVPELLPLADGRMIDRRCRPYLLALLEDCRAAGGCPQLFSAYRSAGYQRGLFEQTVERMMKAMGTDRRLAMGAAAWYTAPPGTSEHQLGLAADISCEAGEAADFTVRWLSRNAWRYGFILRYPEGKEDITGVMYEPWHYRFVGHKAAEELQRLGLTLEEYLELFYD